MSKTSELFEHAQRYMREVMAERLRAEGFSSYKGQDIHWYRLVNGEVVQAIYFTTRYTTLDSSFEFFYGCHPLFIPPIFQKSPYLHAQLGYEQMIDHVPEQVPGSTISGFHLLILEGAPYRIPDIWIYCPTDQHRGRDILDLILHVMDTTKDPRACYEMHKQCRASIIEHNSTGMMSPYFVDEVLYWNDQSLIPYCKMYIKESISSFSHMERAGLRLNKSEQNEWEHCKLLDTVLCEGRREEYLQILKEREQTTLQLLKKNCGIA